MPLGSKILRNFSIKLYFIVINLPKKIHQNNVTKLTPNRKWRIGIQITGIFNNGQNPIKSMFQLH